MSESRLEYLFGLYIENKFSAEEEREFMDLLKRGDNDELTKKLIGDLIQSSGSEFYLENETAQSLFENIIKHDVTNKNDENLVDIFSLKRRIPLTIWMRVAAVVILFLGGMSVFLLYHKDTSKQAVSLKQDSVKKIAIENNVVLRISDGTSIVPDSMKNGASFKKGNTIVTKQGSMLIYKAAVLNDNSSVVYSLLSTPAGMEYQVVLPDGSKVWLNAKSSISFPSKFSSVSREVKITGEAYFEVAKNKEKPFFVKVGQVTVRVLGTHFDIKAYEDEDVIKTSLLEGSVKILEGDNTDLLHPGQQAVWNKEKKTVKISTADMNEVVAWKNGLFQFQDENVAAIMAEIGRWYNVQIEYQDTIPKRKFEGKISRSAKLSEVLKILELTNIKFSSTGNKIIIH